MTLRFNGLIAASNRHSVALWALSEELEPDSTRLEGVITRARQLCRTVDSECARVESSPAQLDVRSREAYAWFALLSEETHVRLHLQALRDARHAARILTSGPVTEIHLVPLRSLWRATPRRGTVEHRFSELFAIAEPSFWQAFFKAFAGREMDVARRLLRELANTETAMEWMTAIEECVPEDERAAVGTVHNLDAVFDRVNERFFGSAMERPQIAWSRRPTRRVFGHYQFGRDRLTLSLSLDSDAVPEFVVDFIMFHELLHKKHGLTRISERLYAHTAAFRAEEKGFPQYPEAQRELARLARRTRR